MRGVRIAVVTGVLAGGLLPVFHGASWACSCALDPRTEQQQYADGARENPYAYLGNVEGERLEGDSMTGTRLYDVRVTEPMKGNPGPRRTLRTPANSGVCGVRLERDRVLVVDDDRVGSCGLTTQDRVDERAAYVRAAMRTPVLPHTGGDAGPAALAVAAVTTALVVRRRAAFR